MKNAAGAIRADIATDDIRRLLCGIGQAVRPETPITTRSIATSACCFAVSVRGLSAGSRRAATQAARNRWLRCQPGGGELAAGGGPAASPVRSVQAVPAELRVRTRLAGERPAEAGDVRRAVLGGAAERLERL